MYIISKSINYFITHIYLCFNWHHVHQKPDSHVQFHYWMRPDRRHLARCHILQQHGQESMTLHRSCLPLIMFVDIQQSLEALSVVVYRQAKVDFLIQDYGTIWVTTFLLRDCCTSCLHSPSSNTAGISYVSPNLDHVSWKTSVFWQFDGSNFPKSFNNPVVSQ